MSRVARKPVFGLYTEYGKKLDISDLGSRWIYYPCSENKGADQLRGQREADLRLCFRICKKRFSHDLAQIEDLTRACPIIGYVH